MLSFNVDFSGEWQLTPVFLPGKFHGQRNLVGYSPWSRKESDVTERLHFLSFLYDYKATTVRIWLFHPLNSSYFHHQILQEN